MKEKESDKMFTYTLPGEPAPGELIPARQKEGGPAAGQEKAAPDPGLPRHPETETPDYGQKAKKPFYQYFQQQNPANRTRVENTILELNRYPIKRNFYELALEYADRTEEEAPEIPFMCYWPSYELMSESQLNFYFRLRTNFRRFEYPKCDLSYIFLYTYELINGIATADAEDGLIRMIRLWNGYQNTYKKLCGYLPEWITDYIDVYKCPAEKSMQMMHDFGLTPYISENYMITHTIATNGILPVEMIAKLSDYAFYKSNFIAAKVPLPGDAAPEDEGTDNEKLFLNGLPGVIKKTDDFMKSEGKGIFETFRPEPVQPKSKMPFRSAIFEKNLRTTPIASDYMGYQPLRDFITRVIKHYENELRSLCGYRGKLKADALPEEIIKVIKKSAADDFVRNRRKDVVITVNKETLARLMREAEAIRKMLLEPVYEADAEPSGYPDGAACPPEPAAAEAAESAPENASVPETAPAGIPEKTETGPGSDMRELIGSLSGSQRDILRALSENGGRRGEKELAGLFRNLFVSAEADSVNEKSLEILSDLLIAYEDGTWMITEDYLAEVTEYFSLRGGG